MQQVGYTNSAQFKCLEDLQRDYVDLYLSYCGTENCNAGFAFGPQARTEYVIHFITKGKGIFKTNGQTYHLSANQAFLIYPDVSTYYKADDEDPWTYTWIGFNGIKSYECVSNAGFTQEHPINTFTCTDTLTDCVNKMLEAHQLTYANELKRASQLMRFFATMIEDQSNNDAVSNYDYSGSVYVKHAINYISMNYKEKIKITELADYIGVNRSYLTNSFKKVMKMSPQEFLVNLRMDKAASLLQKTQLPINTIASSVGYDDPLAFSKIFKQKYEVSPKTFRKTPEHLVTGNAKGDYNNQRTL